MAVSSLRSTGALQSGCPCFVRIVGIQAPQALGIPGNWRFPRLQQQGTADRLSVAIPVHDWVWGQHSGSHWMQADP